MAERILVACFSASGVTKRVGEEIARAAGGDFFEIVPKERYSSEDLDWGNNPQSRSPSTMSRSSRGAVTTGIPIMPKTAAAKC